MNWAEYAVLFAVAAAVTIALTPLARKIAIHFDAIDYPSARRVNMLPIPRMGGIAIFGGILAAIAVAVLGTHLFGWGNPFVPLPEMDVNYWGVLAGVVLIFLVGAIDDVIDMNAKVKLLGQIIAACIVAASGVLLSSIHNPFGQGYIEFGWIAYPLTVFYLVAFANVINLIDGLDGLASGITGISAITILIFAVLTGRPDAAMFSVVLIGACVGFLKSNFYPAKIFMGDSGALLLGFSLGLVSLFAVARSALFVSLLVPILAAGVPILDTFFAIVRRKREHRPIDEADKGHIHHRLMRAGFSQRTTVLIMWGWTALLSACAVVVTRADNIVRIPMVIAVGLITAYAIVKLRLLGDALSHHFNPRTKPERKNAEGQEPGEGTGE
jgi:UDP-GlcNAc:undecaprenyl-phosphate/decaprenyl-phosphate GlcNAc-1-phosphate transferase